MQEGYLIHTAGGGGTVGVAGCRVYRYSSQCDLNADGKTDNTKLRTLPVLDRSQHLTPSRFDGG
jgi:hypothetical protein